MTYAIESKPTYAIVWEWSDYPTNRTVARDFDIDDYGDHRAMMMAVHREVCELESMESKH